MKYALILCGLLAAALGFADSVTVPAQTITITIPAQTVTVTLPAQTLPVVVPPPPVIVTPPPASGTAWGYANGVYSWFADYSFAATIDYADKVGSPGGTDIAVRTTAWGGWLPVMASNFSYPTTGYTKLVFQLKPTTAGQKWQVYFVGVGDVPLPAACGLDVLKYGPAPQVGVWASYSVPLADLCVLGKNVYKFAIQDKTGLASNVWYANNVGFAP